ncbi:MAG: ATP-dependent zinc metalloprotease FtsH [Aquincola sp.]|nr:ATP-dependent zinc metalloprotease FtsH [Aquincola sp.]MDH5328954.1 ATP-dependent zinc metalloprotease FtsH [Aquincola sp.]
MPNPVSDPRQAPTPGGAERLPRNLLIILIATVVVMFLRDTWVQLRAVEPLPYSEFVSQLKAGNVESIVVNSTSLRGTLRRPMNDGRRQFVTVRVEPTLMAQLEPHDVKVTGEIESTLLRDMLGWIVPTLLLVGIWMFALKRMQAKGGIGAGLLQIGKSHAKVYVETDTKVTFDDVAGVDEAKEELRELVGFLKDPKTYGRLGARIPKGVLLVGPPGTGKTLLARAVAGEAGVPFLSINGSEFVEMFVGVGAARVRDLFDEARAKAPAIIFIDEIDALGRARGAFGLGGHDEKEQTLNQLLAELDGFDPRSGVVLLAATNRPEILDPALLRAGRFDRQVLVDRPDRKGRVQILAVHTRKIQIAPGLDLDQIAALTPGFSGADLANLANEAALQATRRNHAAVELADFTLAIERIVAGLEKRNRLLNELERRIVAHHEMGHALVALSIPGSDPVHKVSIIPRGIGTLGYTLQRPTEDRFLMTHGELKNKMAVLLGGRAAEQLVFGELSTGAADDLARATDIARSIVVRYGMDEALGPVAYEPERPTVLEVEGLAPPRRAYAEATAREVDISTRKLVDAALARSTAILTERRDALERGAQALLARETLTDTELRDALDHAA